MSIRSVFGMDGFDVAVHTGVTAIVLFWIGAVNSGEDALIGLSIASCASLILLSVRRRLALRRAGPVGLTSGEMTAAHVAELESRIADLEAAQARVAELEERLDFAERMLAQSTAERQALPRGTTP